MLHAGSYFDCCSPYNGYAPGMTNNAILKKIIIANNLKHFELKEIFELGGAEFSSSQIKAFMAGSKNKNYEQISDEFFEAFLNGFIIFSRGPVDEPTLLPRTIESFIIGLIESGNTGAIEEIRCLIEDASDAMTASEDKKSNAKTDS
jgi:hypothetical protein